MDLSVEGKSERIPPGSHIVQLYNKVNEIAGVTARLLEVGLAASEKCLFAGTPASVKDMEQALAKQGVDVAATQQTGQLQLVSDREPFLVNNRF
ncbi:MAG TPA: MEDS domain-containing protein, partial [Ktedonobacterales bacterium]|nr:MEDS domain-containing protein [Ktedonobacterales bacterium]